MLRLLSVMMLALFFFQSGVQRDRKAIPNAEIDLVIEFSAKDRWAIEVKRSLGSPVPRKGFYIGCGDIHATRQVVLYPGDERFKIDAKTEAMPLETLLKSEFGGGAST